MFLRLPSLHKRSVGALLSCLHTSRCHDTSAFPVPTCSTSVRFSRLCHALQSWRMTHLGTVANQTRWSLQQRGRPAYLPSPVLRARVAVIQAHTSPCRSVKVVRSRRSNPTLSFVRLFSETRSRAATNLVEEISGIIMNGSNGKSIEKDNDADAVGRSRDVAALHEDTSALGLPARDSSMDPESDEEVPVEAGELQDALTRPPAVNSNYLPLPWKGRLGYACLNTYLRYSNPPVFCSRTCRIASILENRYPLQDPEQPPHPTKNRPDRNQPADHARGQAFVESLGLVNARDLIKLIRWNDRYGIKFMRLSSEMFPFASHKEYGYKLEPFASEVLAEVGQVIADLGHRVSVHPGQFTQLGSPRRDVVENSYRDLEYHSEMLRLLKLPPQQDRDAVMILHMGGVFGDKQATLDRFRENYAPLSQDIKNRLVLENDDVSWSVHDLLPICEELNIPLVLDFHHHNIIYDSSQVREGTMDVVGLFDRIKATWTRKEITQKMHYSESVPDAITSRQRRKHSDRVKTLPPCDPTMDLMIEAKDKEQAVFELMRTFKLPGFDRFSDLIPFTRTDENKVFKPPRKSSKKNNSFVDLEALIPPTQDFPAEDVGMGGPEGRVYWPPGMEEWLRPKKVIRAKAGAGSKKAKTTKATEENGNEALEEAAVATTSKAQRTTRTKKQPSTRKRKASEPPASTPEESDNDAGAHGSQAGDPEPTPTRNNGVRRSRRAREINYAESE